MLSRWLWQTGIGIALLVGPSLARADGPGVAEQIKQALAGAKVTLAQAVETAQKEVPGGAVVDAELKWNRAPVYFEVELLVNNGLKEVRLDAISGKLLGSANQKLDEGAATALAELTRALAGAKLTAVQTIEAAAKEVKDAQPLAIALASRTDGLAYEVKLLLGDKLREVKLDAVKGGVIETEDKPLPLALWTFDAAESGQTPPNLLAKETHPGPKLGTWKVAADPTAPSKPNLLTLTTDEPDATLNVGLFDKTAYKDLDLRVAVRAIGGKEDQGGGLVWRAKDENNYYICRINPLENNFRVYKVVDGRRHQLQSTEFKAETGKWHLVRAVMVGDQVACYVDGKKYLAVKDDTFKDAGLIGLWTKADASSSFDDLAVYTPQPESGQFEKKAATEDKEEDLDNDDD